MEETFCISSDAPPFTIDDEVSEAARKAFGIRALTPWQRLVIANIMDAAKAGAETQYADTDTAAIGKQIVLLPTGAGKSLCFQVPALLLSGATLVVYPLLALMADQERRMNAAGIECAVLRGGQSAEERKAAFTKIENGAKIVIANPEILAIPTVLARLKKCVLSHIAIDEAHCVSEWGDAFRPAYLELGKIVRELNAPVVTAFTATASPEVLARISEILFEGKAHIVRSASDRPNIFYSVYKAASKRQAVLHLVRRYERPMIVFCGTRSRAEETARAINFCFGRESARFYHAGLERDEKTCAEKWFFQSKNGILCATCAYGMGVDKPDIRTVIHLDAPETAESYVQEAGRGGRDGKRADAVLLWNQSDRIRFADAPQNSRRRAMRVFAETTGCRRQVLLDALGAEKAVCSGCDNCCAKRGLSGPAANKTNDSGIVLKLAARRNGFYTIERFEEAAIKALNKDSSRVIGLNIWNHETFEEVFNQLVSEAKLKIGKGARRGRVCTAGKRAPRLLRRIYAAGKRFCTVDIYFLKKTR
ncbi:MAG: RecQ family ATP-dependent DNA helicase [Treponema sp.]